MAKRKLALWGCWHVHAEKYLTAAAEAGATVVGVWDEDPARRDKIAALCSVPAFSSEAELLSSDADGVIVCTATSDHPRVLTALAEAGKDIFTEKVLATTDEDAEKIAAAVKKSGVAFVISFPYLYRSWTRTALALVEEGKLGRVTSVRFKNCHSGSSGRWLPPAFYSTEECGGGAMMDLGAHGMYLIAALLGMPDGFRSTFTCAYPEVQPDPAHPVEDNAVTVMTWKNGCIASNETGFVTAGFLKSLEISGTEGTLIWNDTVMTMTDPKTGKFVEIPRLPSQPAPLDQFIDRNVLPGCGIDDAVRLTKMMTGAYASRG